MVKFFTDVNFIAGSYLNEANIISEDILQTSSDTYLSDKLPLMLWYLAGYYSWTTNTTDKNNKDLKFLRGEDIIFSKELRSELLCRLGETLEDVANIYKVVKLRIPIGYSTHKSLDIAEVNRVFSKYRVADCEIALFMITQYLHALSINKITEIDYKVIDKYGIMFVGSRCKSEVTCCRKYRNVLYCSEVTDNGKNAKWYRDICDKINLTAEMGE